MVQKVLGHVKESALAGELTSIPVIEAIRNVTEGKVCFSCFNL